MADSTFLLKFVSDFEQSRKSLEDFSKDIAASTKNISKQFSSIKFAALATGLNQGIELARKLGSAFAEPIAQAAEFEADVNSLRIALDATGQSSDVVVNRMIDFASAMQETTKFSDNAVISTAAYIQNLAQLSGQGLQNATKAALDLATALGIDVSSAAALVGKAANGNIAALKRYGIEIKQGKTDAETFANTLKVLSERFGGAAEKSVNTFAGAMAQLTNNFDDFLKEIGLAIIQNKDFISIIKMVSSAFADMANFIKANAELISGFVTWIINLGKSLKDLIPFAAGAASALLTFVVLTQASNIAFIIGFAGGVKALASALGTMTIAVIKSTAAMLVNPIFLAVAGVAALVAFATKVAMVKDEFNSLKDAIIGVTMGMTSSILSFFGADAAAQSLAKSVQDLKDKKPKIEVDVSQVEYANNVYNDLRKARQEKIKEDEIAAKKARAQFEETATANFDKIRDALKKAGKSDYELLLLQKNEQLKIVNDYGKVGLQQAKEANTARLAVEKEYKNKVAELDKKYSKEALDKIDERNKKISGTVTAVISGVQKGAAGVAGVASSLLSSMGPYGAAAGAALEFLAQGPEAVKAQIQGFIDGIPVIIDAVVASIPVVIDTLAEKMPEIIEKLVEMAPRIGFALTRVMIIQMPLVSVALAVALAQQAPYIALSFVNALITEAGRFITALIDGIKGAFSQVTGGGGKTELLKTVATGGLNKLTKRFATGGVIPSGYPNDSFPARLTSGEGVVPVDTMRRLQQFLAKADSGSGAGAGETVVKLIVGEKELASVMLSLNQRGFRTL